MRVLLVDLEPDAARSLARGVALAGDLIFEDVTAPRVVAAAMAGEPPAAAVICDAATEPIRLAQSLAAVDREIAIVVLCRPERQEELRQALRFAPLVTPNTTCRSSDDLEQLGVDLVEAAQAAVRRRVHRAGLAAADRRLREHDAPPRLRGEALGRLVEAAPIGILTLDAGRAVAAWNARAAEILGAPEREVLGRPVHELFDPADRERLGEALGCSEGNRAEGRPQVFRRIREGAEQHLELVAGPMAWEAGERGILIVLSDVTERVRAERAQRRAEQTQAFLAETGALLDASLDPVETLQRIASLAVPARAELCAIDLLHEDGTIEGVAFAAVDPDVARALEDIRRRFPVDPSSAHPVARVLRTGSAEVLEEMTEATYRRIAQGAEHLALMHKLHYHSALVAPLVARGRMYGAISLLYLDPHRRYSPDDLRVLEDVARRAALALDNARLYSRERRIAETLQRSLLPPRLPAVPGMTLAAHYEPGDGDVGGDWYDVIPLPDGRLACVVGDIVGRGIQAASVMGQLRNAVRVYALERSTAAEVVNAVDRLSDSLGIAQMATLLYAVFEPATQELELCCAGHPPPLVVSPDGSTRYVMGGRSGPVGVGLAGDHHSTREPFEPGSVFLAYTDGLIERRGAVLDEGLARLETAAAAATRHEPAALAAEIVRALRPGAHADDVALLVLRAEIVGNRLRLTLPAELSSVRPVRQELRRWLSGRVGDDELYEIVLACSEACANAVEHAYALTRGTVEIEGDLLDGELTLVVRDFGRWRGHGSPNRGRGTSIMRAAMDEVEMATGPRGTEVVLRRRLRSLVPA